MSLSLIEKRSLLKLHWRLFIPLLALLWLIIGINIFYFVSHEKLRQRDNLENRLLNVNNTVIAAYERNADLQRTVDFIRLFTDNTTLSPLRITVYNSNGEMVADNDGSTIVIYDDNGNILSEYNSLIDNDGVAVVHDIAINNEKSMISSLKSPDGKIFSFAALPYKGEVLDFLSYDPMVWILVILLGVVLSVLVFFGVRAVCRNVYALKDFAEAISLDHIPQDLDSWQFSNDELGQVSKHLLTIYRDKIHAEQERILNEKLLGMNISHELKTPVGIIKGYLDTILSTDDMSEDIREKFLIRAQQNVNRLSTLIRDLSMVMQLDGKNSVKDVTDVDFRKLISQIAEDVKQGHILGNMKFEYSIPDECFVIGHESLLTNAVLNLVYNSAMYSEGTVMSLKWIGSENGSHTFVFSDNGIGVGSEHLNRLFNLFYRVDSGRTRKKGGTGLGLPLVQRIILAMGGQISVENGPEGGLQFTFSLPIANK